MQDEKGRFTEGNKIGNRFSSENQPLNNGRRPSLLTNLERITKKEFGVELSKTDYDTLYAWALERTPEELKELQDEGSNSVPLIVLVLVKSLLGDIADGKMNSLKMIMDQINKKPDMLDINQNTDINISPKTLDDWYDKNRDKKKKQ